MQVTNPEIDSENKPTSVVVTLPCMQKLDAKKASTWILFFEMGMNEWSLQSGIFQASELF